jgi:hypothetical protein
MTLFNKFLSKSYDVSIYMGINVIQDSIPWEVKIAIDVT